MPSDIADRLSRGFLLADGAMGTQLLARSLSAAALEELCLTNPDVVRDVHLEYIGAGSELILTNTFGANALRLGRAGLAPRMEEINRRGVAIAQDARRLTGQDIWVAGSIGSATRDVLAMGALGSASAQNAIAEQAAILADAGVDLLVVETFASLADVEQAVRAIKSVTSLPVIAELTFNEDALTPAGNTPEEIVAVLEGLEVVAIGANCSVGPEPVLRVIERMAQVAHIPLVAQPNAGYPQYVDGKLTYEARPAYVGERARALIEAGAVMVGGCCGTTGEHIAAVRDAIRGAWPRQRGASPSRGHAAAAPASPGPKPAPSLPKPQETEIAARFRKREFIVTVELDPPRGFDISSTLDKLRAIMPHIHAVNVADNPRAQGRMSALAASSLIQSRLGVETILHMATRHRNLLALHSDLLGAHALGVRNVFTVMGDVPVTGDYPQATAVADITTSGLIGLIAGFNNGVDANGKPIDQPTSFFIGAALNLMATDLDRELSVLNRKVAAGANFLLSQPVYDPEVVERVAQRLGGFPVPLLMGVLPLRTLRHAQFLHNEVPGISIPPHVFKRLERADEGAGNEGIAIVQELLNAVHGRVAGAYFIPPFGRYEVVAETMKGVAIPGL
jgi:homocysteine S-methyltransferase